MIDQNKIYSAIPSYVNETYLSPHDRSDIAYAIFQKLKDTCEHEWQKHDVKLIDACMCKKCGKIGVSN